MKKPAAAIRDANAALEVICFISSVYFIFLAQATARLHMLRRLKEA